ncbi:MAG: PIG-L family deacetylase [Candidatus Omnitrophica bacterium]|nr:PIG-L family deacetylase [Candidatus Omnitrophota bacterium]
MKRSILVVAAHPDDEILGCGATLARLAEEGHRVHILILGEGITSRDEKHHSNTVQRQLVRLHKGVGKAGKILGVVSTEVLNFPDNRFDTVPLLELVKAVARKKREVRPQMVLTHHAFDLNIDHQLTFKAALTACRPVPREIVQEVYSFEVPSSTEWQRAKPGLIFCPTFYVEVKKRHLEKKIKALAVYASEMRPAPHPRSPRSIRSLAKWRGSNVGRSYAECFEVVRRVW